MITALLLILIVFFILGKFYSAISNETPSHLLELKDINDAIRKLSGVWWFMIPVVSLLAILYNIGVAGIWFILIVLGWLLKLFKWVWNEIIIAGGWMLLKILFHYLIVWPWRIFKAAFEAIKPSVNLSNYKAAVLGLFLSFLLAFTGKFMVEQYELSQYISYLFTLLSILPLGLAIASIVQLLNTSYSQTLKELRIKYLKHTLFLIILFFTLFIAEGLLIYAGTYSPFKYIFSSIMVGGSLLGSLFIIFNAVLLLFILSALPSFSFNYNGTIKNLPQAFGTHLFHKWPQYILALPALLIPALLISIIPYFITKGIATVSQGVTDGIYDQRIQKLDEKIEKENKVTDYANWLNVSTVTDDSVAKLIKQDYINLEDNLEIASLKINRDYLHQFYNRYASPVAAAPVGILFKAYTEYGNQHSEMVNTRPYRGLGKADSTGYIAKSGGLKSDISQLQSAIKSSQERVARLNSELEKICVNITSVPYTDETKALPENFVSQKTPIDNCEEQRAAIKEHIEREIQSQEQFEKAIIRHNFIIAHLNTMKDKAVLLNANQKTPATWGYFIVSLWLSLLLSLALGLALSLFAHLNHTVFGMDNDGSNWMVFNELSTAKSRNPNQPLLGLVLLFPLLSVISSPLLFSLSLFPGNFNPNDLMNIGRNKFKKMMPVTMEVSVSDHTNHSSATTTVSESPKTDKQTEEDKLKVQHEELVTNLQVATQTQADSLAAAYDAGVEVTNQLAETQKQVADLYAYSEPDVSSARELIISKTVVILFEDGDFFEVKFAFDNGSIGSGYVLKTDLWDSWRK